MMTGLEGNVLLGYGLWEMASQFRIISDYSLSLKVHQGVQPNYRAGIYSSNIIFYSLRHCY